MRFCWQDSSSTINVAIWLLSVLCACSFVIANDATQQKSERPVPQCGHRVCSGQPIAPNLTRQIPSQLSRLTDKGIKKPDSSNNRIWLRRRVMKSYLLACKETGVIFDRSYSNRVIE
jgi:hypothetical protein